MEKEKALKAPGLFMSQPHAKNLFFLAFFSLLVTIVIYLKIKTTTFNFFMFFKPTAIIMDLNLIKQVLIKDFHHFQYHGLFNNHQDDPLTGHLLTLESRLQEK